MHLLLATGVPKCSSFWFIDCSWKCWFPFVRNNLVTYWNYLLVFCFNTMELALIIATVMVFLKKIAWVTSFFDDYRYENSRMPEYQISEHVKENLAAVGLKVRLKYFFFWLNRIRWSSCFPKFINFFLLRMMTLH